MTPPPPSRPDPAVAAPPPLPAAEGSPVPAAAGSPPGGPDAEGLTSVADDLDAVIAGLGGRPVTLERLEAALRHRGAAVLILVLSVPFVFPIAIPLLATVCGLPMIALGLRMVRLSDGRLPGFVRRRELSAPAMLGVAKGLRRLLKPVALLFRPRLGVMFRPSALRITGLSVCLAALVLSLPLPVPFANMIPALGLIHLAAGQIQRDGAAVLVGHAFTAASYLYLWLIWDTVWRVLGHLLGG